MEMDLGVVIEKLVSKVRLAVGRTDNIKAFGELWLFEPAETEPIFKVKGFVIKLIVLKSGKEVLTVDFPAYVSKKSKTGFRKSFITENKSLLDDIRQMFSQEYAKESGDSANHEFAKRSDGEKINLDELPF